MPFLIILTWLTHFFFHEPQGPKFKLIPGPKVSFNSFVDCNMAEAWVADTFRIFPGKYREDPL